MSPQFLAKVRRLADKHHVGKLTGPFAHSDNDLNRVETFIHEVAHWVCAGGDLDKLPSRLSAKVSAIAAAVSKSASNTMELDTSLVTFLVGCQLDLWDSLETFACSCSKNLRGYVPKGDVLKEFLKMYSDDTRFYVDASTKITRWLKPSQKIKPITLTRYERNTEE